MKIALYKETWGNYKGWLVQETYSGSYKYKEEENLIDNYEFAAELEYVGFTRGRSSLNIMWADRKKKIVYYSGMSLLDEVLKAGKIQGNILKSDFTFKKQGTAILLKEA